MKSIVFLGSNKSGSSREAIKAAERMGYFTILLTDRERFLEQRTEFPDVHKMVYIDVHDNEAIQQEIKNFQELGLQMIAIISFIEPHVYQAAKLSEKFCHTKGSTEAIYLMEDKIRTREILKGHPASSFYSVFTKEDEINEFTNKYISKLPLIVKTPNSTGSKDVILATNEQEFKETIEQLFQQGNQSPILIEEYLEGPQYLVEVLVENDNVHIIGIIEQTIEQGERFIITGYSLLPSFGSEQLDELCHVIDSLCKRIKLRDGAAHFEMRRIKGKWKLIEANPRISGGVVNRLIKVGTGLDLCEETIKLILGKKTKAPHTFLRYAHAHYLTVDKQGKLLKVTGKNRASRHDGVVEVFIKPRKGKRLQSPMSMRHRYGYVLAVAEDKEKAIQIAREAAKEISFHVD
ncbi:ATP-grasp domain-containing protein [Gracilibacillus saliphilus]|uniref:ATP-grasp domain-containing protein n=1 Tax=Gracilibacillus saliphilus TaxID=543890 RepID=UPI0013D830EA|nr:ATP-grasp domain-containing protein [Gracilibacillus saliphilus]